MKHERCPACRRRVQRSSDANRRYWALLHRMSEVIKPQGVVYSAETWHTYCKSKFLGCDEARLPNGKVLLLPRSTADLDVSEFSDYMTKVEAFANEHEAYLEDGVFS